MCLEGNGWDLGKAITNFEELKVCPHLGSLIIFHHNQCGVYVFVQHTIPPDAFVAK